MSLVDNFIEVTLKTPDDFLKVKETLTRIGFSSKKDKALYQSCHILHKRGQYYIVHFKELFLLDGKETEFTENDMARRNTIAKLLSEWGLVNLVNEYSITQPQANMSQIKIVPFKEKGEWDLIAKYSIGTN